MIQTAMNPPWDRTQLVSAALILIVVAGAFGFWLGRTYAPAKTGERKGPRPATQLGDTALGTVLAGGNAIAVNDQLPGMTVDLSLVTLAQDGWVVVHEDRDGKPGSILGARRFSAGENQSGTVELLRVTQEGKVYYAMLHADDGDRQFDHTKDLPLRDPQGNVIVMRFVAASRPAQ